VQKVKKHSKESKQVISSFEGGEPRIDLPFSWNLNGVELHSVSAPYDRETFPPMKFHLPSPV
jgi:hypothetical protein